LKIAVGAAESNRAVARDFNRAVEKFSARRRGYLRSFQPLCNRGCFQPHQPHFNRAWKCLTYPV